MKGYDLYEVRAADLLAAKRLVEVRLGVALAEHESGYHGGIYFRCGNAGHENLILKTNFDPAEELPLESRYPHARFLLYVSETDRSEELRELLTRDDACELLRHELL